MSELVPIIFIIACVWATVDIMQSHYVGVPKIIWILSFWFFAPIGIPIYIFLGRKRNQSKPKFGGSAWGSIIGLMFAGPMGAIAGAYLGHSLARGKKTMNARSVFQINLISILSYVVKVDGKVDESEIQSVLQIFQKLGFATNEMTMMTRAFESALTQNIDLKITCENFRKVSRYEESLMLLRMVYIVVMADKKLHVKEEEAIRKIIDYLGIHPNDHMSLKGEFVQSADKYYAILGLHKGASLAEVKKAYRKLALSHHPDRVGNLGDEYRKIAEEKFKEISEAHSIIIKELRNK
ncbi:MAG: DnaJ like chaperone protein [Candidatus Omnitrophota bacterium]|jgi:DnaJ like chaperone protein